MKALGRWLGALALTLLVPAAALAGDIKVGLMCPLTGKWASEGLDMKNIVTLLVDDVNAKGGVKGRKIELVVEDDAGDPRTAALAAQKLASAGVVAVIGTYGSAVTEASQSILDEAELVQIGTGSTSVRLTEKGLQLFFRTCPRDDAQGRAAAAAIEKGGYKAVALLHDNSSYAKGLAEETKAVLEKAGVKVVFFDALTPGERDYTAILTKLKAANPDLVFFTGYYPETGMSVLENLRLGAFCIEDKARSERTLEWIFDLFPRLEERKHQLAGTLSGGEQQMLAIGRALMSKGPAVRATRAQMDRQAYQRVLKKTLYATPGLRVWQDSVTEATPDGGRITGVRTAQGLTFTARHGDEGG